MIRIREPAAELERTQPPIEDYAIIGDCRTAALVSSSGAIDWLCLPRFDGPSVFARILDVNRGGTFAVQPTTPYETSRHYLDDTNVIETVFRCADGVVSLQDAMIVYDDVAKSRALVPDHEVLRRIECRAGPVEIAFVCEPRPGYGQRAARLHHLSEHTAILARGPHTMILRSDVPLQWEAGRLQGRITLEPGQRIFLSLATDEHRPGLLLPLGDAAQKRLDQTVHWWRGWLGHCTYDGTYASMVRRSALTLKLLTYPPSGAIIAAPTTSLPEVIGGQRNWDYRYCWLRDAAMTLRALLDLGFVREGEAFLAWLLHATRLTAPELNVLYDVHGRHHIPERELHHLAGYHDSKPVRIGNGAHAQFQLDVYGEVILAATEFVRRGGQLDAVEARFLAGLGRTIIRRWREPDHGIWEARREPRHHTHSKAMCWVGLQCLLELRRAGRIRVGPSAEQIQNECNSIRYAIETRGFDPDMGCYVAAFDTQDMDATLLLLGINGYVDADSDRMRRTHACVRERLEENELLRRYDYHDGLPGDEATFGICSFWETELLAAQGRIGAAHADFEHVVSFANDVGLFAEEIDPKSGRALGNFPQAFTHIGLISAAAAIARAEGRGPERAAEPPATTQAREETANSDETLKAEVSG